MARRRDRRPQSYLCGCQGCSRGLMQENRFGVSNRNNSNIRIITIAIIVTIVIILLTIGIRVTVVISVKLMFSNILCFRNVRFPEASQIVQRIVFRNHALWRRSTLYGRAPVLFTGLSGVATAVENLGVQHMSATPGSNVEASKNYQSRSLAVLIYK